MKKILLLIAFVGLADNARVGAFAQSSVERTQDERTQNERAEDDPKPVIVEREIEYVHRSEGALSLDFCRPTTPNGAAVLFIASDGWVSHQYDPTPWMNDRSTAAGQLVAGGFAFVVVRHRSGREFTVPDAFDDVQEAVRFVRSNADRFGLDPNRMGVFGKSAGGHLGLLLGTVADEEEKVSHRIATAVAWSAPTDLRPLVLMQNRRALDAFPALGFEPRLAASVSPLAHVSIDDASMLLLHGTNDRLVPVISSGLMNRMVEQAGGTSRFVAIKNADHFFGGEHYRQAVDETVRWFRSQLTAEEPE